MQAPFASQKPSGIRHGFMNIGATLSQKKQVRCGLFSYRRGAFMDNIFSVPEAARKTGGDEFFENMLSGSGRFRMERVVSYGQTTPEGVWYDQHQDEWVAVLEGSAKIGYPDGTEVSLEKGDSLFFPKGASHRVTYTSAPCIWLAVFGDGLRPE